MYVDVSTGFGHGWMSLTYTERGTIFMLLCQPVSDTDGTHGKTINEIISNKWKIQIKVLHINYK